MSPGKRLITTASAWLPRVRVEDRQPGHGLIACRRCGADREHHLIGIWLKTGVLGRFLPGRSGEIDQVLVECRTCHTRYDQSLRDRPLFGAVPSRAQDSDDRARPEPTDAT
jgi:hypothetical protein